MTLNELVSKFQPSHMDCSLTVAKHDKGQLRCFTTVPIESAHLGFDWTADQIVLEPSVRLNTHPEEVADTYRKAIEERGERLTHALSVAAEISRMIEDLPDEKLRGRIRAKLMEM